ncbi:AAA family ATPase [Solihabitans fulvus]|uniref:AAA family ATPase n=1 Tax=Solihabitans fulvus TaxID=1892852 RepID=A0A5B2WVH1_9PSEU|nr:NB-ARC domain-containing protein [Solihabitans fulvus]KAA2254652.1 AAA family ATPase [Solihabitans fulvus]
MGRPERPLDPASGPVAAFAMDLRELRQGAGNPSYRELAQRALFSPSVLSTAAGGLGLPTLRVTLAFVEACGGDQAGWERRWHAVAEIIGMPAGPQVVVPQQGARTGERPSGAARSQPPHLSWPAQLPAGTREFVGRHAEFARMRVLTEPAGPAGRAPVVVSGPAGIGKSAFAVRLAQQLRTHFPDGQLYAALGASVSAYDVLGDFLRALGVQPERVPSDCEQRAGLYRSLLAQRRVVVVLDDAADERQVRPLLSEAPASQVIITSCGRLTGLDGVCRLVLNTLPAEESLALIGAVIGPDRAVEEADAIIELAELCDHLPLALRIMATRIAAHPGWTVAHAVSQLRDPAHRLDRIRTGDVGLRSRLRRGYRRLDSGLAQRAFRHLAELPGPGVRASQLALLLEIPVDAAEDLLEVLLDGGLLQTTLTNDAYCMPRLFRAYARERLTASLVDAAEQSVSAVESAVAGSAVPGCRDRSLRQLAGGPNRADSAG